MYDMYIKHDYREIITIEEQSQSSGEMIAKSALKNKQAKAVGCDSRLLTTPICGEAGRNSSFAPRSQSNKHRQRTRNVTGSVCLARGLSLYEKSPGVLVG